jgi:hypothetical protein
MSKKQTRRAAREAFPKAKAPAPAAKPAGGKYSSKSAREKARTTQAGGPRALRPPTWRRAAMQGGILAVLYFVVIQFLWKGNSTPTIWGSLIIAVGGFILYTGIAYYVDRFNYNRKLRRLKGSSK